MVTLMRGLKLLYDVFMVVRKCHNAIIARTGVA